MGGNTIVSNVGHAVTPSFQKPVPLSPNAGRERLEKQPSSKGANLVSRRVEERCRAWKRRACPQARIASGDAGKTPLATVSIGPLHILVLLLFVFQQIKNYALQKFRKVVLLAMHSFRPSCANRAGRPHRLATGEEIDELSILVPLHYHACYQ
jgi:hypothetical protein